MKLLKHITLLTAFGLSSLSAHSLWINSFESYTHKPGHITVGLGWGHSLPIDDIPNSTNAKVIIEEFSIIDPKAKKTILKTPLAKPAKPDIKTTNFNIYDADIALQKIALKKDSLKGLYKLQAKTKPTFYTKYIDTKDRERLKLKSKDKVKDIKKVLMSVNYQVSAVSYLSLDKWEEPKATNKGLEIIPKTDLSNVKIGDLVKFEVFFNGKPLSFSAKSKEFISAYSKSFGQGENFYLASFLKNGKAQFRVQSSGQWIVSCGHKKNVTKNGSLKDLYGKVNSVINAATLTFNVK